MEFTAAASWLNTFFAGFDNGILEFMHTLETSAGGVLTPLAKFITLIGEKGLVMFILAFAFMLFPKTRKLGVCMFGAVCCGALITNIILKDLIARPRPFEAMAPFMKYWNNVGSPAEDGFSFPSGHVTAAAAGMAAMMFVKGKKFILPSALYVFLMCFSRNSLMAHYPSDVLAASIVGLFSAFVAYLIASFIFEYCEDNDDLPFFNTILYFRVPLPDMSGLINKINRVPSRDSKAAKSEKKRASTHSAPARDTGRHSVRDSGKHSVKDAGRHSGRHSAPAQAEKDDDFSFTVDMADELLSDTGSIELDIDELRSEAKAEPEESKSPAVSNKAAKREKSAAPAFLGSAMAKAGELAKKSRSSLASAQKAAKNRVGSDSSVISIHTSELDFDFAAKDSGKKKSKGGSDWNERWEQYLARRDQAQVKTVPAQEGSAQMEFENIFGKSAAPAEKPAADGEKAADDALSNTSPLFAQPSDTPAVSAPQDEEEVKVYKPAKEKKQAEAKKPEAPADAPKAEEKKEEAPKAKEEKAPEAPKVDPDVNFDHMRRRPGTNTGSIEIDMDEIYSMINGSYDFSRD